jgi:hypothetical protein
MRSPLEQFLYDTGIAMPGEVDRISKQILASDWLATHDAEVRTAAVTAAQQDVAARDAVLAIVREQADEPLGTESREHQGARLATIRDALRNSSADALDVRDEQKWDEGYERAESDHDGTGFWSKRLRANPYRDRRVKSARAQADRADGARD